MLRSEFEQAIGRAIADAQFCARLITDPVDALLDYGLRAHEARWIQGLFSVSLADLIEQVVTAGAQLWGADDCNLLRELHSRLLAKQFVHVAGLLPISDMDERGQLPEPLWPEGTICLN